jgi:hypothetical protein
VRGRRTELTRRTELPPSSPPNHGREAPERQSTIANDRFKANDAERSVDLKVHRYWVRRY